MTTPTERSSLKANGERLILVLEAALEQLNGAGGEVVLDFSSIRRIDPSAVRALESFAGEINGKAPMVVLQGVNIDVYRVLKLARLTPNFSFRN